MGFFEFSVSCCLSSVTCRGCSSLSMMDNCLFSVLSSSLVSKDSRLRPITEPTLLMILSKLLLSLCWCCSPSAKLQRKCRWKKQTYRRSPTFCCPSSESLNFHSLFTCTCYIVRLYLGSVVGDYVQFTPQSCQPMSCSQPPLPPWHS